jgi:hypothetical protein
MNLKHRFQDRSIWFIILSVGLLISYFISNSIAKKLPSASCAQFRNTLLLLYPIIVFLVLSFIIFFLPEKDEPSSMGLLVWLILIVASSSLIPVFAGDILLKNDYVQKRFCNPRYSICKEEAEEEFNQGQYDLAEQFAYSCLKECASSQEFPDAEQLLSKILVAQLETSIDKNNCDKADIYLEKLENSELVDPDHGGIGFAGQITALKRLKNKICSHDYSIKVINQTLTSNDLIIDIQVTENDKFVSKFQKGEFHLKSGNTPINIFDFSVNSSDTPVCIIPVVDNSESSAGESQELRNAIRFLNNNSMTKDRLGMVVFGGAKEVKITTPGLADLNEYQIDGEVPWWNTALFHALEDAIPVFEQCGTETKYLVLLSDGNNRVIYTDPTGVKHDSRSASEYFSDLAKNKNIRICTIGVPSEYFDPIPLQMLATNCGYYPVGDPAEISKRMEEILHFEREFYRIKINKAELEGLNSIEVGLYPFKDEEAADKTTIYY